MSLYNTIRIFLVVNSNSQPMQKLKQLFQRNGAFFYLKEEDGSTLQFTIYLNYSCYQRYEMHSIESLNFNKLCGFCIFSMRFVIFMDLFATVVQPAGMIYVIYLIYSILTDEDHVIPTVSLIMIGCIYGLQVVIFILKVLHFMKSNLT